MLRFTSEEPVHDRCPRCRRTWDALHKADCYCDEPDCPEHGGLSHEEAPWREDSELVCVACAHAASA